MYCTKIIFKILIILIFIAGIVQAKDSVKSGNEAFEKGDYSKAAEYYKLAIQDEPEFYEYINLGHCYMQLKQWSDACSAYEEAIKLEPEEIKASIWHSLGRAYFESCKFEKAKDAFSKALTLEPENDENETWIARCLIELEQWIEAQSVLLGLLSREPDNTVVLKLLAYIYNQQDNQAGIISIYRELLKIEPKNMAYRITLAKMLMNQGQITQAIDILEFAKRLELNDNVEVSRLLGDLYLAQNMPHEAIQCYQVIINKKDKPSAEVYYRLGYAYFQVSDFLSSRDIFNLMREKFPEDSRADLYLGRISAKKQQYEEAETYYVTAIKKNPESLEGLKVLSDLQMKNKRYSDAALSLAKVIDLGGGGQQVYYNYIVALIKDDNPVKVKAAIKKAMAEYPSDKEIRYLLNQYIKEYISE